MVKYSVLTGTFEGWVEVEGDWIVRASEELKRSGKIEGTSIWWFKQLVNGKLKEI